MPISMERWNGKVAIVTGASSGIGEAVAKALVEEGLQVIAIARRKNRLDSLATTINNHHPGKLHPYPCDLTSEPSILSAFTYAKTIGPIHILINAAGIFRMNSLRDGDLQKWKDVIDVNVLGLCVATREAVKDMTENHVEGHIVHVNCITGHKVTQTANNVYSASKFAVRALTETLRMEMVRLGSKVKVTSLSPGVVKSELGIAAGVPKEALETFLKERASMDCRDAADAVLYVLGTPKHVEVNELILRPLGQKD